MNRLEVLYQIDKIFEQYDQSDNKAELDKKLFKLRKQLTSSKRQNRIKALLKKGRDLTFSEIQWLLDQEVQRLKIAKAMNMGTMALQEYLKNHGVEGKLYSKEEKDMSNAKGDIERAKKLLKETELTVSEIAKRTGALEATVYYHSKRIRKERKKEPKLAGRKVKDPIPSMDIPNITTPKIPNMSELVAQEKIDKLNKEIEKYKKSLDKKDEEILELKERNIKLRAEWKNLQKQPVNDPVSDQLEIVQKKHDLLLEYIQLG